MADVTASLVTARELAITTLATVMANPKPDYSLKGRSISWNAYQSLLMEQIKDLTVLIQEMSPFEIRTKNI